MKLEAPPGCALLPVEPVHLYVARVTGADYLLEQSRLGPSYTLVAHGKVAALFGLVIPWPGLAEAWLQTTPAVAPIGREFVWLCRRFFGASAASLGLRRIQMHVHNANEDYLRFARALKFRDDALLEAYGPNGEDMVMMSRIYR